MKRFISGVHIRLIAIIAAMIGFAVIASAKTSNTIKTPQSKLNITIEIKDTAQPLSVNTRYRTLKRIPKNTYQPWAMDKGSRFSEKAIEFIQPKDKTFLEILILFKNQGSKEEKVEMDDVRLEFSGGRIKTLGISPR